MAVSFLGGEGTPMGLHLLRWERGGGAKTFKEWATPQSCISPLEQTLVCVVTGLKRTMNYNMLWKIYKRRILTLQEKALLHRQIFKTFPGSVRHVYLMADFKL